jgi:predicted HTH transcriptional regulator
MSANELFGRLDTSASIRTIKADLATLKKAGLIEQIGKGPSAQWKKKPS